MAPIYDTDIAEERWSQAEWEQYELWEKVELRLRRRKRLWIGATVAVVLGLFALPIVQDQSPKWDSLRMARTLATEINAMKRDAAIQHSAFRIRFEGNGSLAYRITRSETCAAGSEVESRRGELVANSSPMLLVSPGQGSDNGVPGLMESLCYDPHQGSDAINKGLALGGFAIIPAKDLTEGRMDRLSLLLLNGTSAEISFD